MCVYTRVNKSKLWGTKKKFPQKKKKDERADVIGEVLLLFSVCVCVKLLVAKQTNMNKRPNS
jgi:hypothetical protein